MLKANKNQKYEIKECDVGAYHVLVTRKTFNFALKTVDVKESVSIFDKRGYEQFKKFKPADIDEAELIHDPVYAEKLRQDEAKRIEAKKKAESEKLAKLEKEEAKKQAKGKAK